MQPTEAVFDWGALAFSSKRPINDLKATFIMAPREISTARFKELVKAYLPKGNIVLGIAKEPFVLGFEDQPQFRMQQLARLQRTIDLINKAGAPHRVYILQYFQSELRYILENLTFQKVIGINGSWKYTFHTQPPYYILANNRIDYELVSPFTDDIEAKVFEANADKEIVSQNTFLTGKFSETEMLRKADQAARFSYDYNFQTGAVLGKKAKESKKYDFLAYSYNKVVPYQTCAMLRGASREQYFSPPHDLNHYDTVHAEVMMILKKLDFTDTTLFINLLPCPTCARMLTETGIAEFIYQHDHSDGYALKMLQEAGKIVRRIVL